MKYFNKRSFVVLFFNTATRINANLKQDERRCLSSFNVGCNYIAPKILQLNQRDGVIYWCVTVQKDVPNAPYRESLFYGTASKSIQIG